MLILVNALSARRGGGQTYLKHLLENFPDNKSHNILILAPDSLPLPTDKKNIKRILISEIFANNPFARIFWEIFILPGILKRLAVDVLFCPGGIFSGKIPLNCKVVTTFQNMMPFDLKQRSNYPFGYMRVRNWLLERKLLRSMINSDLVIFISYYASDYIQKRSNNKIKNYVVIPHGVDKNFRRDSVTVLVHPEGLPEKYILYVSILDVYKAQVEVVKAYALLKKHYPVPHKLILIGPEYAPYAKKVHEAIKMNDLEDSVIVKDAIANEDLPALYQHAAINIFASMTENCPFILLEALAAGRPLVVSNYPPMPEFACSAVEYFDPTEPLELADVLERLLKDDGLRKKLSDESLKRSMIYDWDISAKKTWESIVTLSSAD